jgi:hypothetical protein
VVARFGMTDAPSSEKMKSDVCDAAELGICCGVIFVDQTTEDLRSGDPLSWERDEVRVIQGRS